MAMLDLFTLKLTIVMCHEKSKSETRLNNPNLRSLDLNGSNTSEPGERIRTQRHTYRAILLSMLSSYHFTMLTTPSLMIFLLSTDTHTFLASLLNGGNKVAGCSKDTCLLRSEFARHVQPWGFDEKYALLMILSDWAFYFFPLIPPPKVCKNGAWNSTIEMYSLSVSLHPLAIVKWRIEKSFPIHSPNLVRR